jgi:hypothetical protein
MIIVMVVLKLKNTKQNPLTMEKAVHRRSTCNPIWGRIAPMIIPSRIREKPIGRVA